MHNLLQKLQSNTHYIDGQWISDKGEPLISTSPVDNSILWTGTHATAQTIHDAYLAAQQALPAWANLSIHERSHHLHAFAQHIERQRTTLSTLIALETGKPRWEAETETSAVIAKINISIDAYHTRTAEKKETDATGLTRCLRYKPQGVMAVLGPFNFPAHLSNGHITPALLAGNTVVYKPSELTPMVAAFIMQCWHESGLPVGVLNLIQGNADVAKKLLNEAIQGIAFTGSYRAGLAIHQQMINRPDILLALEMGGNNPLVFDRVRNIPAAVYETLLSSFITAGQRCTGARRIIIPDTSQGDDFLNQLQQACLRLRIGAPSENPEPFMGPVISHAHALQHLDAQRTLQTLGGNSLLTMKLLNDQSGFLSPGIMDMTSVHAPPDEEIFAPFIQIYRYHDFDEALRLANQTRYGLAAGLLSDDATAYTQFYQTIRAGLIYWNRATTGATSQLPFGGVGQSGNHRPSAFFAADYCAYPIASMEFSTLNLPATPLPGINLET